MSGLWWWWWAISSPTISWQSTTCHIWSWGRWPSSYMQPCSARKWSIMMNLLLSRRFLCPLCWILSASRSFIPITRPKLISLCESKSSKFNRSSSWTCLTWYPTKFSSTQRLANPALQKACTAIVKWTLSSAAISWRPILFLGQWKPQM